MIGSQPVSRHLLMDNLQSCYPGTSWFTKFIFAHMFHISVWMNIFFQIQIMNSTDLPALPLVPDKGQWQLEAGKWPVKSRSLTHPVPR